MALINKVLIVGGGVGGMCAAIQCARQGIEVDLVEINPDWAPDGAGITISGPSLRALRTVGVVDEVLAQGGFWSAIDICDAQGQLTRTVPMATAHGAEELPCAAGILRPVLADILGHATQRAGANVRLGLSFDSLHQDADGVDVRFTDGSHGRYDLVVGADGVNSRVRQVVMPDFPGPQFTGQGSWRAVVPRLRENSTIYMGRTTKAGMNPISATECYLFVLDKRAGMDFIPPAEWPARLAELLQEFGGQVGQIRDALLAGEMSDARLLYRPLAGHMIDGPWHRGRIVLLGDTVHATTPHLASGAGIAMEGAIVLAEELARRHSLEGALLAYAGRHYDRARLVVSASGRLGQIEQQGGSVEAHTLVMRDAQEKLRAPL
ncbi:2-polyprenyl-6-methoxyphenol hydroxylase-like FAD-dependent oxidoreductase [Sphaerotilus hippei]|uniref:2-polyprenyl-6-methoxyphenol hydroxylase-like FAD-dependent oxidoreductase n=1 Tax=Sphaerotilus hippei TaxID=744406 RepID=A0A318H7F3_9BURK|nr:FAD-dependent oxidoreductase [Sphaerotilus hippei]PXW97555.1 2-polyprenyl-6-methoxyphenol hydroxylase-like FAD-dependent oxidoreductase [Sphaerotilus hippei]